MASVYLRDNSPFYMARFRAADGAWTAKSTKHKNRTKALEVAHLWESGGKMLLLENPQGAQFEKVLRGLYEQMTGTRMEPNPAGAWLRQWVKTTTAQRAKGTGERYGKVIEDFVRHLGTAGASLDLRTITQGTVQAFLNKETASGKSGTTVVLNAKILRAAFNHAIRSGIIERNPAGALSLPEVAHQKKDVFTEGNLAALLKAAKDSDWQTAIMLGRYTGMRLGDAANLKWESVDMAKGVITYMPAKTIRKKKVLKVPMAKELARYIDKLASADKAQKSQHLCPTLAARDVGGRAGLSREFMVLMETAGVDSHTGDKPEGKGRAFSTKSFHSLRHTIASNLGNNGTSAQAAQDILGHASGAMTERYTHLKMSTLRAAVNKLPTSAVLGNTANKKKG